MPEITRTFTVAAPPERVLAYLADFGHAVEWDPGTEVCTRLDNGPVAVGSRWHNVSKIAGVSTELEYTLRAWTDDRVVLAGSNETASSTDTITAVPHGTGSEVTYTADIELHGAARLASPVVKLVFERIGTRTEKDLQQVLDRLV